MKPRRPRLYILVGSFFPPGVHLERIVERIKGLLEPQDRLVILPCGIRPEPNKAQTRIRATVRIELCMAAFGHLLDSQVRLDTIDLQQEAFTPHIQLATRFAREDPDRQSWFVNGLDVFAGTSTGTGEILGWKEGRLVWEKLHFLVLTRPGFDLDPADLPPHHELLELNLSGSSSEIRRRLSEKKSILDLVSPAVARTIEKHNLQCKEST